MSLFNDDLPISPLFAGSGATSKTTRCDGCNATIHLGPTCGACRWRAEVKASGPDGPATPHERALCLAALASGAWRSAQGVGRTTGLTPTRARVALEAAAADGTALYDVAAKRWRAGKAGK